LRVFVTGAGGQLGRDVARALAGHDVVLAARDALDVTDAAAVHDALGDARPDAVIHAAAWTDVDACERDRDRARRINVEGTRNVARAAGDAFVVVVSTDYVFDGTLGRAYVEIDGPNPLQVYGHTKLGAERAAKEESDNVAIARTAWLYGAPRDGAPARNFVRGILDAAAKGTPFDVVDDQVGSPTWTADLARALARLVEARTPGTFHVANAGAVSRYDFARAIVAGAGGDASLVRAISTAKAPPRSAVRPAYAPLEGRAWAKAGFPALAPWEDALSRALPEFAR
jgi:dTDP-4-dehydrorhamnose reductase